MALRFIFRSLFFVCRGSNSMKIYKYQIDEEGASPSFVKNMRPSSEDFIAVNPYNGFIFSMNKIDNEIELYDLKKKHNTKLITPTLYVHGKHLMVS